MYLFKSWVVKFQIGNIFCIDLKGLPCQPHEHYGCFWLVICTVPDTLATLHGHGCAFCKCSIVISCFNANHFNVSTSHLESGCQPLQHQYQLFISAVLTPRTPRPSFFDKDKNGDTQPWCWWWAGTNDNQHHQAPKNVCDTNHCHPWCGWQPSVPTFSMPIQVASILTSTVIPSCHNAITTPGNFQISMPILSQSHTDFSLPTVSIPVGHPQLSLC